MGGIYLTFARIRCKLVIRRSVLPTFVSYFSESDPLGDLLEVLMRSLVRLGICAAILAGMVVDVRAGLTPIGPGDFPANTTMVDLTPVNGADVQGLTVDGITFAYTSSGPNTPSAIIDGGPGTTNHITPPNVVSEDGNPSSTDALTMTFAQPQNLLGYGFALLDGSTISSGSTVTLYDSSNNLLGSITVGAAPDPNFAGGFLGVLSTTAFSVAVVTFGDPNAPAFALGNIEYAAGVPEPSSVVMAGVAVIAGLGFALRRRLGRTAEVGRLCGRTEVASG